MKGLAVILCLFVAVNFSYSQTHDLTQGLIFHLPFAGNTLDQSSSAIPVFDVSNPSLVDDKDNNPTAAIEFANLNQNLWLDRYDASVMEFGANDFSIGFWVKRTTDAINGYHRAGINKWHSGLQPALNEWRLDIGGGDGTSSNKPRFAIRVAGTEYTAIPPTRTVDVGQWVHLMGVREGSDLKLYVDGVLERTLNIGTGAIDHTQTVPAHVYIGRFTTSGTHTNAAFDDIVVYDKALTSSEISELITYGVTTGNSGGGNNTQTGQWSDDGAGNLFYDAGKVSVGAQYNNANYAFAVKGEILTEGITIQTYPNWPDYVFEPEFDLLPLDQLERFISINKHLPEVPSASEVLVNGIRLQDIDATLLKKIEELTLYTIEQEKKIEALELSALDRDEKLNAQKQIIKSLIDRLEKLEKK